MQQEQDWLSIAGRRALVAGAGGLGGASATSLAAQGATVIVVDLDGARLVELAAASAPLAGSITGIVADLGTADGCRAAVVHAHLRPRYDARSPGRMLPVSRIASGQWSGRRALRA